MSLARLLYILGIVLMVWAVISGFYFNYKISNGDADFNSGYSFKLGVFIIGALLVYLGRKSSKKS